MADGNGEGEGAGPANETKAAKWKRLAGERGQKVMERLAAFAKLFEPKHYDFTAEQVGKTCDQWIAEIEKIRAAAIASLEPKAKAKEGPKFSIE